MNSRRNFLKKSVAVSTVALTAATIPAMAKANSEANIFAYSKENPGRWEGKAGSHAPVVTVKNDTVTIETKHGMAPAHYIVKHTLLSKTGEVLGEKVFFAHDKKAISSFTIKGGISEYYALSYCNLHDQWVTKFHA
jgi:superoxide reductase